MLVIKKILLIIIIFSFPIEIKDIEPPKPDFAIPYRIIAGTTVKTNIKFISIKS